MIGTDGTLPFDPQRIAEGILEGVQRPPAGNPSQPGTPGRRRRSDLKRKSVEEAVEWLNSTSNAHPDKTKIELYLEKRTAHGNSLKHKDHSYKQALDTSKRDPRNGSVEEQRAAYEIWVAENYKRLNGAVQAAHMDWVTTANKADVEYHLSIVDLDLDRAVRKVLESQEAHTLKSRKLAV